MEANYLVSTNYLGIFLDFLHKCNYIWKNRKGRGKWAKVRYGSHWGRAFLTGS